MTYQLGEMVILQRLMGEDLDPPVRGLVVDHALHERGRLFTYEVMVDARSRKTGRQVKNTRFWVKDDWLIPAQIIIQETPESPFD